MAQAVDRHQRGLELALDLECRVGHLLPHRRQKTRLNPHQYDMQRTHACNASLQLTTTVTNRNLTRSDDFFEPAKGSIGQDWRNVVGAKHDDHLG
jgi:hypothetical protein